MARVAPSYPRRCFLLYKNGSTDGGPDVIRRSPFARNVTLIDWPGAGMQIPTYQDFRTYHAAKFDWAAVIDLDEFFMPVNGNTIREPLTRRAYSDYSSILLQWYGLVIESYTRRLPDSFPTNLHVKPLVRGKAVSTAGTTPHLINVSGPACNTRGQTVLSYAEQPIECHDVLAVNHYYPKSREDWLAKIGRGKAHAPDPAASPNRDATYYHVESDAKVEDRNRAARCPAAESSAASLIARCPACPRDTHAGAKAILPPIDRQ